MRSYKPLTNDNNCLQVAIKTLLLLKEGSGSGDFYDEICLSNISKIERFLSSLDFEVN
jgi:hypothetical protein